MSNTHTGCVALSVECLIRTDAVRQLCGIVAELCRVYTENNAMHPNKLAPVLGFNSGEAVMRNDVMGYCNRINLHIRLEGLHCMEVFDAANTLVAKVWYGID